MIIRLEFTNAMPVQVEVRSNVGSDQPLMPRQSMQMTFELQPGQDGIAEVQVTVSGCAVPAIGERLGGGGTVFHPGEPGCVCTGPGRLP